jgi:CBS domain containing-hemolysin-like protein
MMADSDAPKSSDTTETSGETRNLPVPVPPAGEPAEPSERWFTRVLRSVFGWKTGSIRSDLEIVLEAGTPGDTGFSPEESAMLKNILGLRERRTKDVMVPRADIVAVQEDIPLGELVKVF